MASDDAFGFILLLRKRLVRYDVIIRTSIFQDPADSRKNQFLYFRLRQDAAQSESGCRFPWNRK